MKKLIEVEIPDGSDCDDCNYLDDYSFPYDREAYCKLYLIKLFRVGYIKGLPYYGKCKECTGE